MRLDKLLSHSGFGTRKEVKNLLKKKVVTVNGTFQKDGKVQVSPETDLIEVFGEKVEYQEFVYFMLHKPKGVISATTDNLHETVIDLLQPQDQLQEPFPVGRLDIDTEGLLLLTNDGNLAHELLSPKKHVNKVYQAEIKGIVIEKDAAAFLKGVTLEDGYNCKPAELVIHETDGAKGTSKIEVTIHEGKFHQVKRMFESVDKEVTYLKRLSMGPLYLDENLQLGEYRTLTQDEIESLKNRK
ncbi:pseudouridine synthase [Desemzia sp. FAM 23991]|uniref:pseudouridine synthase n=1 Tax=unclassified Desemzia TaxID=2685243 RepID=UPI00388519C1